ncbi:MAG: aldose epimerase family protein [Polyangia bacterium]
MTMRDLHSRTSVRRTAGAFLMGALAVSLGAGTAAGKDREAGGGNGGSSGTAGGKDKAAAAIAPIGGIEKVKWGQADGKEVDLYTLTNKHGLVAKITNYGAILVELHVPDKKGNMADIAFGYDSLADYVKKTPYFGATVGRVANRIANATFDLDGKTYKLAANNGAHHLHGGKKGWDKVVWDAEAIDTPKGPSLKLTYVSKDGEEGYPGTVTATTVYTLTSANELAVDMTATTDTTTIVNMAHHTYFNLNGAPDSDIKGHLLTLHADKYTPGAPPDGKVVAVAGTPFDFRKPKAIGKDLLAAGSPGNGAPIGYDSNWIVNGNPNKMRPVARVEDPASGRVMTISANQPGVQFYAGIFLDGSTKGKGRTHPQYGAFCLETQKFPNAINVPTWRDQVILKPGQTYKHNMIHKFSTK